MLSLHAAIYSTMITAVLFVPVQSIVLPAFSMRMYLETLTQAFRNEFRPQLTSLHEAMIRGESGPVEYSHAIYCHPYIVLSYAGSAAEINCTRLMLHRGSTRYIGAITILNIPSKDDSAFCMRKVQREDLNVTTTQSKCRSSPD